MNFFKDVVADVFGNSQKSVSVTVKRNGSTATIYSDQNGTVSANPLTSDSNGFISFWYQTPGTYTLEVNGTQVDSRFLVTERMTLANFGAVGDGVTDDTTALTNAFAAAKREKATLYAGPGVFKHTTTLTVQGFNLVCEGPSRTRFEFYGTGTQMIYLGESGAATASSDETKGFMLLSKAAGQNGLLVQGNCNGHKLGAVVCQDHDGVGVQFGVLGSGAAFFANIDYIWCHASLRTGTTGCLVDGSSNANVFRNIYVGGKWTTLFDVRGSGNIFIGGDAEFNQSAASISSVFNISGCNNQFIGMYIENDAGAVFPSVIWQFTSTAVGNSFERPQLQMQLPAGGIEKYISDQGLSNYVHCDPHGLNYPYAQKQTSSINLLMNTEFRGIDGSPSGANTPYGWFTFGATPMTRDTTITRGQVASLKISATGSARACCQFLYSSTTGRARFNIFPLAYFLGKNLRAGCWVYSTVAGCGDINITSNGAFGTSTSATHSGSGTWEFLSTAVHVDPTTATDIYFQCRIEGGITGDAYFSEPVLVVGNELPAFSPAALFDNQAYISGRICKSASITFADGDTTPSVFDGNTFDAANSAGTTITNFTNGFGSQEIKVFATNGNTTIKNNANIQTTTGADKTLTANTLYKFMLRGSKWIEY